MSQAHTVAPYGVKLQLTHGRAQGSYGRLIGAELPHATELEAHTVAYKGDRSPLEHPPSNTSVGVPIHTAAPRGSRNTLGSLATLTHSHGRLIEAAVATIVELQGVQLLT